MRGLILLVLYIWCVSAQQGVFPNNFQGKLTSERGGPPSGAQFVPIPVVDIPPFTGPRPMTKRPKVGQPPPPPPPINTKPTRRPKLPPPISGGHIAPPPPAKPVPVDQSIPLSSMTGGDVPALPPDVTVVTAMPVVSPDQETVATPPPEQPTTTPRTRDYLPALFYRLSQNEDLSYFFDFEAPNTVARSEQGFFKQDALFENPVHVKTGMYSFTSPEGVAFRVNYVADERGYRTFTTTS